MKRSSCLLLLLSSPGALSFLFTPPKISQGTNPSILLASPLASEGDWAAFLDEEGTGLVYYFNSKTGESLWEAPTSTFPQVMLRGDTREKARKTQLEYAKNKPSPSSDDRGVFAMFSNENEKVSPEQEVQDDWFSGIFADRKSKQDLDVSKAKKKSWFSSILSGDDKQITRSDSTTQIDSITLEMASYILPHPDKIRWGGEDAVMTKGRTFGVFDGVSGADKLKGVPLYSRTLASEVSDRVGEEAQSVEQLTKVLTQAAAVADRTATGASTCIVASISPEGFLRVLNVGDSTCIVVRDGKVAARSIPISHYHECPYQLSSDSPDRPRDGTKLNVEILRGDLILMASDGVFDNIDETTVANTVASWPKEPSVIAKRISEEARKVSFDKQANTPYAKAANNFGDPDYPDGVGGKVDDIGCVVVQVA